MGFVGNISGVSASLSDEYSGNLCCASVCRRNACCVLYAGGDGSGFEYLQKCLAGVSYSGCVCGGSVFCAGLHCRHSVPDTGRCHQKEAPRLFFQPPAIPRQAGCIGLCQYRCGVYSFKYWPGYRICLCQSGLGAISQLGSQGNLVRHNLAEQPRSDGAH